MKVVAKIVTSNMQRYEFEVPQYCLPEEYDKQYAEDHPVRAVYDWLRCSLDFDGVLVLPGRIIYLGDQAKGATVDVMQLPDLSDIMPGNMQPVADPDLPHSFEHHLEFLGLKTSVFGFMQSKEGKKYYLPTQINGSPAHEMMAAHTLERMVERIFADLNLDGVPVIPPVTPANDADAVQYLMDYVAGVESTRPVERTARAVQKELFD